MDAGAHEFEEEVVPEITVAMWVRHPDVGGIKIPAALQRETMDRLIAHAEKHYAGLYKELVIRFRGPFCYIDALRLGEEFPMHLCRLRHYRRDHWSLGFYTYSHEKYELAAFPSGSFYGTPEEGLDVGAVYLQP